jgi:hypothetical protein
MARSPIPKVSMPSETRKQPFTRRLAGLELERSSFVSHWQNLSDNILPRRGRFFSSDRNKGGELNKNIINSRATLSARTLASGMMSGITSPARPWFRLVTPDPALMEHGAVREWLHKVEMRMRLVFARSNFYNALHVCYEELGVFGTACVLIEEDFDDVIRCYPMSVGDYYLANSSRGTVNTVYRKVSLTVIQVVEEFGFENCSDSVKTRFTNGALDDWVEVIHVLEPNPAMILGRADAKGKPIRSVYFEEAGDPEKFLREGGYFEFPAMAPRWHLMAGDVYGRSPGMDALGDVRALQVMERRKAQAIDKMVNPPLTGPASLKSARVSSLPGDVTYSDTAQGMQGLRPIYEVQPRVGELVADIQDTENRVREAFYADLFLMLANDMRNQRATAREIEEKHEEKLLMLGPVLERIHDELLNPAIDRVYAIMERGSKGLWARGLDGLLPKPPQELDGVVLRVEYVSLLAQAQQAVSVGGIERVSGYVGNLIGIFPEVRHKFDAMQAVDEYARAVGVAPTIIKSDEDAQQAMAAEQKKAAEMERMAQMGQMAQAGKLLSEVDTGGRNILSDALGTSTGM